METFENKLSKILESTSIRDPGSSANNRRNESTGLNFGGPSSIKQNEADKGSTFLKADARRKKRERARTRNLNEGKVIPKTEEEPHPRELLIGEMRLTLKEKFLKNLLEYIEERDSGSMLEALELMEEYPKLKEWAKNESTKSLPKNGFCVYSARESMLSEEVGQICYREEGNHHNWFLNKEDAIKNLGSDSSFYISKAKVSPDQVILFVPAFAKHLENLIYSRKIEEREGNPVREAKRSSEIILPENINSGIIIETRY